MVIDVYQIYLIAFNSLTWLSLFFSFFGRWRIIFDSELWVSFYLKVDNTCISWHLWWLWWLRWLWFNFLAFFISTIFIPPLSFSCKLHIWWWKQIELFFRNLRRCIEFWIWFTHRWVTKIWTSHSKLWGFHCCVHLLSITLVYLYQLFLDISLSWYCLKLDMLLVPLLSLRGGLQLLL